MTDTIQPFIFENANIRGILVRLEECLDTALSRQAYPPAVNALLAETLISTSLLVGSLSFKGQLILQLQNQGAIKLLVAKCSDDYGLSGLAQWDESTPIESIEKTLNEGKLVVTLMHDEQPQPQQSIVTMNHQTVSGALEDYFKQSEQLPTKIFVGSDGTRAAGLLLQQIPPKGEAVDPKQIDDTATFQTVVANMSAGLDTDKFLNQPIKNFIETCFTSHDIRLFDQKPVRFHCSCSVERMKNAIRTLGEKEARDILLTNKQIEITCEFCANQYTFNKHDVDSLFSANGND